MNPITELTQELATQFSSIVGRSLTASEYFEIRNQAIKELDLGYRPVAENTPIFVPSPMITPTPVNNQLPPVAATNVETIPNVEMRPVTHQDPVINEPQTVKKIEASSAQIVSTSSISDAASVVTQTDQQNDDFFTLVNKFAQ